MVARRILIIVACGILTVAIVFGQEVQATARVDSSHMLIGDWLTLYIDIQHREGMKISPPEIADSLEGFEVVHRNAPVIRNDSQHTLESFSYIITAFDSGVHVIPPLTIRYSRTGDTTQQVVETSPIPIFVRGIAIDTTGEIKDVKPPLTLSISIAEILPYIIGAVILGGVIWLIYYITKKRKRGETLLPAPPPRPAHEIALEALQALDAEKLWQRGKVKEYYSQLTDIVRTYIERTFGILSMEMTTDEILSSTPVVELPQDSRIKLQEILVRADLVKFAKMQPLAQENETSLSLSISFVQLTSQQHSEVIRKDIGEEIKV